MSNHVLVDRTLLRDLLREAYGSREEIAIEGGAYTEWHADWKYLQPDDHIVMLAVQAGIVISAPLAAPPPAPPIARFRGGEPTAPTYRAEGDNRLRCSADAKVVYCTEAQAVSASGLIGQRQRMKHYQGACGHWHVARVK